MSRCVCQACPPQIIISPELIALKWRIPICLASRTFFTCFNNKTECFTRVGTFWELGLKTTKYHCTKL
jgi:hypothetical protein